MNYRTISINMDVSFNLNAHMPILSTPIYPFISNDVGIVIVKTKHMACVINLNF